MKYGKNHGNWKSEKITYSGIHAWIKRTYGPAVICENNDLHVGRFEWANISGKYKRNRKDFKMLCQSCHKRMDNLKRNGNYCPNGHEYTKENLYTTKQGWRICIICKKDTHKRFLKLNPLKAKEYRQREYLKDKEKILLRNKKNREKRRLKNDY